MGKIQAELLVARRESAAGVEFSTANRAGGLDEMVAAGAAVWAAEDARRSLHETPFAEVLAAIERGRPAILAKTEIALYQLWLEANPGSQLAWAAWFNIGCACGREGDKANAATAYGNALALRPGLVSAAINLGLMQEATGRPEEALATWRGVMQPDEERVSLQIQQGRLLEILGRFDEAETILHRVLQTDPAQPDVVHHWVHLRQKTCNWPALSLDMPALKLPDLLAGSGPLGILALTDDIELQAQAAANWVARKTAPAAERLAGSVPYGHKRIRIGYMSSDFCSHAMSYLITELFERHDRTRFEVFGFCASNDDGSALRRRVVASFDHFRVIRGLSDEEAARLIRADEIDVLIDLNGITDGSRLAVMRWRPAPIQATYLGFIGPIPMPELDYLLCDDVVIPPEHRLAYHVTPLVIGPLYQANDSKRTIGARLSRVEAGLPEGKFVFCCFTKHFKITEEMFAAWMEILRRAPDAVLWLAGDNAYSRENLETAAASFGIATDRLIFSDRADPDLYMSRLGAADLFLDTFPYNAGTVASDALRMELPLITLCGEAFASRMATSLLCAIGAPQGVTTSLRRYIETAVKLATDPPAYARFKALFTNAAWRNGIGDIARFTKAYEETWERVVGAARAAHAPLAAAIALHHQGRLDEAEALYLSALKAAAPPALAAYNLGLLRGGQNRFGEAGEAYRRALEIEPQHVNALVNLGTMMLALGQAEEAEGLYRRAIARDPHNAMAHGNLGKTLQDAGRLDEAFAHYHAALALQPENAGVLANLGAAFLARQDWAKAEVVTRKAVALQPDAAMAHANLANALLNLGRYDEAAAACRLAMALPPLGSAMAASLGGIMLELGSLRDAVALCEHAIAQDPDLPDAYFNLSHAWKGLNNLDAADESARRAIVLRPDNPSYHFHLAHILLLRGAFAEGWEEYEWRWKLPDFAWAAQLRAARPQWNGEDIAGKTLLIFTEQGIGDIVQFVRFVDQAKQRAGGVILAVRPALRALLECLAGVTIVDLEDAAALPYDVQCPLMSLPRALQTRLDTIPARIPYLHAPPEKIRQWATRIGTGRLRIGIIWAGNPATRRDRFRSPGLASVKKLFDIADADFTILQMGPGRDELAQFALPGNVRDFGPDINDLTDTAAIMANLDLVISSCTGPLHLAASLGVQCWAMLPFAPHFPWLLAREDTDWYKTMRLYRQAQPGLDWSDVVDRIAVDIGELLGRK
jgi:predicted O-linked N-acetylglucosamine transferase (SPINDLY family)